MISPNNFIKYYKLADRIIEYLRASILIFLELKDKIEKESFLNTIDNSLLHEEALAKLKKLIDDHCSIVQIAGII